MEIDKLTPRILVGRFFHESNGYTPSPTLRSAFEIHEANEVLARARGSGTTLSGIVATLEQAECALFPLSSVAAPPGGRVDHRFFTQVRDTWLREIKRVRPDGMALELHGAMATEETDDADGDLLRHLREAAGDGVAIAVGLDLHAHISPQMLDAADICIACKENPHSDVVECGNDVAALLLDVLNGRLSPVMTMSKTRMLLPGKNGTQEAPLADLHRRAREIVAADPDVRDISLYNAFRFLDAKDVGQATVVLTNGTHSKSARFAAQFAEKFWTRRDEFHDDLPSIGDALDRIADDAPRAALPYVIADMGDRVLAGAPGDSTKILAAVLHHPFPFRAAVPVTDPDAARLAQAAGIGATVTLTLGGTLTPGFDGLRLSGTVSSLTDGAFAIRGPYQAGELTSMGPTATITVDGRVHVVATSRPAFSHDPNAFESQGVTVAELDLVVVKSGYHYALNFDGIAMPLPVASPGLAFYAPGALPRSKGPVWPDHDVTPDPIIPPAVFDHSGRGSA